MKKILNVNLERIIKQVDDFYEGIVPSKLALFSKLQRKPILMLDNATIITSNGENINIDDSTDLTLYPGNITIVSGNNEVHITSAERSKHKHSLRPYWGYRSLDIIKSFIIFYNISYNPDKDLIFNDSLDICNDGLYSEEYKYMLKNDFQPYMIIKNFISDYTSNFDASLEEKIYYLADLIHNTLIALGINAFINMYNTQLIEVDFDIGNVSISTIGDTTGLRYEVVKNYLECNGGLQYAYKNSQQYSENI